MFTITRSESVVDKRVRVIVATTVSGESVKIVVEGVVCSVDSSGFFVSGDEGGVVRFIFQD